MLVVWISSHNGRLVLVNKNVNSQKFMAPFLNDLADKHTPYFKQIFFGKRCSSSVSLYSMVLAEELCYCEEMSLVYCKKCILLID